MITGENLDRRFWIGASDTLMVMSNHKGKTFQDWWFGKVGLRDPGGKFSTIYTRAGDLYEKPIARFYGEDITEDRTILLPEYSLRVNLDADIPGEKIIECKTYKAEKGILDRRSQTYRKYVYQIMVQQFAWEQYFGEPIEAEMRIYYLEDEDYEAASRGYALQLDPGRVDSRKIQYDKLWIEHMYLPKLMPLAEQLKGCRDAAESK